MKPYFSFSILLLVLLLGLNKAAEANRLQQHYWKHVMGDEVMPDAIKDLLPSTPEGEDPVLLGANGYAGDSPSTRKLGKEIVWEDLINRDFDTRSAAIIYHRHDDHHDGRMMPGDN